MPRQYFTYHQWFPDQNPFCLKYNIRTDFRLAPSQREASLQSNAVSHWLGSNLESTLSMFYSSNIWLINILFPAICTVRCQNGGVCIAPDTCHCPDGLSGDHCQYQWVNSIHPGQNGRHFADDIFRCIFVNAKFCVWLKFPWSLFLRV